MVARLAPRRHRPAVCGDDASFIGLVARHALPGLVGEVMHGLTRLGGIAFAYAFRQWLDWRYGQLGAFAMAHANRTAAAETG
jgi:hypothetical protein